MYSKSSTHISAVFGARSIAGHILLFVVIFLVGYAEATLLKLRGVACMTWLIGLAACALWIADPATPLRVAAGLGSFLSGIVAVIIFYRKKRKLLS